MNLPEISTTPADQSQTTQQLRRSRWLFFVSLALSAIFLYLALRGMDWVAFWKILRGGNYWILMAILPLASLNYLIRSLRWRILVNSEGNVSVSSAFWANMTGYLGNAFLPARAGELLRSAFLGRKSGLGTGFVLATALTERIVDAVALVAIGSTFLLISGVISSALATALKVMALLSLLGLVMIFLVPSYKQLLLKVIDRLPVPIKIKGLFSAFLTRFLDGMRSLHNLRRSVTFIAMTALIWLLDGLATSISAHIISQSLTLSQSLVLLSALGLSSAIPSTPGYVGISQLVAVIVLVPFGFSHPDALAFILISQVMNTLVVSFWGLIGLWKLNQGKWWGKARKSI